ncbi:hypothetical protein Bca4012_018556 [Brassica carinata]
MKNSERLETARKTCLPGNKRNHIIQAVQYLDERLRALDEEKEELRKYQQLDKQRKSLEYTIYDKELHDTREELEQVEVERTKASEESTKMYDRVEKAQDEYRSLYESLTELTKELQTMNKEKETVEARKTEAIKKKTKLELDENDFKERIAGNIQSKNDALEQLGMVEREIQDSLKELEAINPLYESHVDKEKQTTKRIMEMDKKLNILYQKQGHATQFSNKATRDKWLRKEIKDLKPVLDSNIVQEQKLQNEIFGLNADLKERDAHIKNHGVAITELESHISKEKWGEESQLSSEIDKFKTELERAKKNLDHAIPGDVRRGLSSIKRICSEHKINGVFGPLVELVDCEEKFFTAVEVTAGNSLFHVVVENDNISTEIIKHLSSRKGGRVTFIPLNRVIAPHVNYPQSSDAVPLLRRLKFDSRFALAFGQVFGRKVVCQDLNVATRVAKSDGLDRITLEGDQVNRKGGMTGGFYDHRRSKLRFMNTIIQNTKSIDTKGKVLADVRRQLQDILFQNLKNTQLVTEQQRLEADWTHRKLQVEQLKQEIANATKQKHAIHKSLEQKEKSLGDVRTQMEQLRSSMAMKKAEMATEVTDRIERETRKAELETNLSTNLKRRINELHATISSIEDEPSSSGLETQELDDAKLLVEEVTNELESLCRSIDEKTKQVKRFKDEKAKLKTLQDDCETKVQGSNKKVEELFSLRNTLLAKQKENRKKIMGLGPLSSEAFDTYDRDHDEKDDGCGEAHTEGRVEKYDGVKVKKCDPAPFYLFDEIDAALDTQYRTAVGNMIRGLADDSVSTQFITTTFRPELVKVADKIYGVSYENRASTVQVISNDQALNFIQNDHSHNT